MMKKAAGNQQQQQRRTRIGKHKDPTTKKRIVVLDDDKANRPESEASHFLRRLMGKCGRDCIHLETLEDGRKVFRVSEDACPVCLTSAKRCPNNAVKIVNLPSNLVANTTHRYGTNAFVLHGLPMPRPGHVLGLLGCNGIGKSTAMNILSGHLKPNLGVIADEAGSSLPTWDDIVRYYRGSDLQNYFRKLADGTLRFASKAQLGSSFTRRFQGRTVREALMTERQEDTGGVNLDRLIEKLELGPIMDRQVQTISGGERQRLSVGMCAISDADVYLFDEPTAFLDVKQRLAVARVIRDLVHDTESSKYVIVVEHDLTVLDYVSDYICCLYGEAGAYGVVSQRSTTSNGINQYIAGYLKSENVRFRDEALSFQAPTTAEDGATSALVDEVHCYRQYSYPAMSKTLGRGNASTVAASPFTLTVEAGSFRDGEIVGLLAQNGSGKTTFMEMIKTHFDTTGSNFIQSISYKRQHSPRIYRTCPGTVEEFLNAHMQWGQTQRMFTVLVKNPLKMDSIKDLKVQSLSTGQLQRLMICVCLGTPAQLYLLDEPSAFLDCEMRLVVAKAIKRWIVSHLGKPAFVVEHDLVMASALQDRVIVFEGKAGVACTAKCPTMPADGLNAFLRQVDVTLYQSRSRDHRPRINKRGSRRDREQKKAGEYFATTTEDQHDGFQY